MDTPGTRPLDVGSDAGPPTTGGLVPSGQAMNAPPAGAPNLPAQFRLCAAARSPVNADRRLLSETSGGNADAGNSAVDLYWIPLGAGSLVVPFCGRVFEALSAFLHRRDRCDLYHAGLQVRTQSGLFTIEQTPVPDDNGTRRGVVAVGPVGTRLAGRLRVFRYEVRCWQNGTIPDLHFAVASPVTVSRDPAVATAIITSLPHVPTFVWGRDEAGNGEMWNSNSVVSWVLTRAGVDLDSLQPPPGGRAPGWGTGRIVAENDRRTASSR